MIGIQFRTMNPLWIHPGARFGCEYDVQLCFCLAGILCEAMSTAVSQFHRTADIAGLFGQIQADGKMIPGQATIDKHLLLLPISPEGQNNHKTFSDLMTPQLLWFCKLVLHIMMWFTRGSQLMLTTPTTQCVNRQCSSLLLKLIHKIQTSLALYTKIPTDLESETTANQKTREVKWSKLATHTNHTRNSVSMEFHGINWTYKTHLRWFWKVASLF